MSLQRMYVAMASKRKKTGPDDSAAKTTDVTNAPTGTFTLRISPSDRALLDRLVELEAAAMATDGVEVTRVSVLRKLIRREAKAKGLE